MRINLSSYVSPFTMENQGYVVLYIIFDIFSRKLNLKIGVTRREWPDRHYKKWRKIFVYD